MTRFVPLFLLAIVGCAPAPTRALADELNNPPAPPATGLYYECANGNDWLQVLSTGKVQVSHRAQVSLPYASGCYPAEEAFDVVLLCEGTYVSSTGAISGGKLKSVFTRTHPGGPFSVYWPATNGTATGVLNRFTITAPLTGAWDGSSWTATISGYCADTACPAHSSAFAGGEQCYAQ